MACPFFMPMEKFENGAWLHAHRLPLGCGWSGQCTAPGHEGEIPSLDELQEFCNLGYAGLCTRQPRDRAWDSVRFGAKAISETAQKRIDRIQIRYICERDHQPVQHGHLEFDIVLDRWLDRHPDSRVQRMAECYLAAYLEKKKNRMEPLAS